MIGRHKYQNPSVGQYKPYHCYIGQYNVIMTLLQLLQIGCAIMYMVAVLLLPAVTVLVWRWATACRCGRVVFVVARGRLERHTYVCGWLPWIKGISRWLVGLISLLLAHVLFVFGPYAQYVMPTDKF